MITPNQMEAAAANEADGRYNVLIEREWLECDTRHGVKFSYGPRQITGTEAALLLRKRPNLKLTAA